VVKSWRQLYISNRITLRFCGIYKCDGPTVTSKLIVKLYVAHYYLPESNCSFVPPDAIPYDPQVLEAMGEKTNNVVFYDEMENATVESGERYLPLGHRYFLVTAHADHETPIIDMATNGIWTVRHALTTDEETKPCLIALIWSSRTTFKYKNYSHIFVGDKNDGTACILQDHRVKWYGVSLQRE